jgi:transcriptional regulator with PAS, ATPase and Fis domain
LKESLLETIGHTPLVKISRLNPNPNPKVTIAVKLEGTNPGGSIKDRVALYMITTTEKNGELTKDKIILEPTSRQMKKVMEMSVHVGKFDCTVLIQGESGVGKEIIAQTIVQSSERKEGPFIKINCGAIPETLLESELFGYEKGAFTGADPKGKTGMFEMANKGTILLDEVGEIPISLQVKLLRVLQEKEIIRVGGTKPIKLNIRIIAATNQNLEEMVREGTFREDLYYRINVVSIIIPPLRKRPDDIPALTKHFLHKFNKKYNLNKSISPQLQDLLLTYPWPGNVRELQNLIENLVILTQDDVITPEHLPAKFLEHRNNVTPNLVEINKILPLKEAVNILETNLIKEAMQRFGTTRRAASILKVDQSTLVRKMQKHKIKV